MLRQIAFGATHLKILPAALLASLAAFPALARQDPTPKPSGIVIHLFGPGSITSPGSSSSSSPSKQQAGQGDAKGGSAPGNGTADQNVAAPTMGQVLHQMFVTGDPAQDSQPHFAPGRSGE